ncbi:hypothetical protein AB833_07980 [Chromatiales bacterium (ex Bugula neritina AB1)]|nr:hypothetical protein AB833_07980 [Chromatiales bacterium (ex Bugula neritina AB1)]
MKSNFESSFETNDEKILFNLASKSFLSVWSYSNLYRDQGDSTNGGAGKEFCDFTAIFGNDVLLFSDKRIEYKNSHEENVAWNRWHKKAVVSSANQLRGAERWLLRYPNRIFLDKRCTERLQIPLGENPKIHKVVVTHGLEDVLKSRSGESSFSYTSSEDYRKEFWIRQKDYIPGDIVHVFTGDTLAFLMNHIDTTRDFVEYLIERECVFTCDVDIFVFKESDLVHMYYKTVKNGDKTQRQELVQNGAPVCTFHHGISALLQDHVFHEKRRADWISYFWDGLIENISHHIVQGTAEGPGVKNLSQSEIVLRRLADFSRFERRIMSDNFWNMWLSVPPKCRGNRVVKEMGNVLYVFVLIPEENFQNNEQYRNFRRHLLCEYICIYGLEFRSYKEVVGIAAKTREEKEVNEITPLIIKQLLLAGVDYAWWDNSCWTDEDIRNTVIARDELISENLLNSPEHRTETHRRSHEFKDGSSVSD